VIRAHRGQFPVSLMCRALGVSRAGLYAAGRRGPSPRAQADAALRSEIRTIHATSRQTYGSPRVHAELRAGGRRCGRHRVARLMQAEGLQARRRRRFRVTTQSRHGHPIAANVLGRRFAVGAPDQAWAGDITYLPTREGWLYLAVLLDLGSRRVIGWAVRSTLERGLTLAALRMALARRRPAPGVLHHSDRGSQYACTEYRALLAAHGLAASMSRAGDCWDNAVVESFLGTLKTELVEGADWATRAEAEAAVGEYLEAWYNRQRRHSALGYASPVVYELLRLAA
jgi:putative transposase